MKDLTYDENEKEIFFKPKKNQKLEEEVALAKVLSVLSVVLMIILIIFLFVGTLGNIAVVASLLVVGLIIISVIFAKYAKYKKIPKVLLNQNGISLIQGKTKCFLAWNEFSEFVVVPEVKQFCKKELYSCVCFSSVRINCEDFREKIYLISKGKLKQNEAFGDNFIFVILSNDDAQIFSELCLEYVKKYEKAETQENIEQINTVEINKHNLLKDCENKEKNIEGVSYEAEPNSIEFRPIYNENRASKSKIISNIVLLIAQMVIVVWVALSGIWLGVAFMLAVVFIPTLIMTIKNWISYVKKEVRISITEEGITQIEKGKTYFLNWKDFECLEVVPDIDVPFKKEPQACVYFSTKKMENKELIDKMYKVNRWKLKRKEAFQNNFIYVILSNKEAQIFHDLSLDYVEMYAKHK